MKNQLEIMIEKLSDIEKLGIYIEEIRITDRFKLMDEDPMTITGIMRPAGEYFCASIDVLIAVDKPSDEIETLKTQLKEYPEVQDVCIKKKNNETPANIGTIIRRDTVIKGAKKAAKK